MKGTSITGSLSSPFRYRKLVNSWEFETLNGSIICDFHRYALNLIPSRRMVHSSNPVQRKRDIPTSLQEGGALIVRARQPYLNASTPSGLKCHNYLRYERGKLLESLALVTRSAVSPSQTLIPLNRFPPGTEVYIPAVPSVKRIDVLCS